MEPDKQTYYEQKLTKLLQSPSIQKIYDRLPKAAPVRLEGDSEVKIYDKSATSPFNQFKKQSFNEVFQQQEIRKAKNAMQATIHQKGEEQNSQVKQEETLNQIQKAQKTKQETKKEVESDIKEQKESLQQRLAERRRRATAKGNMNNSVILQQTSNAL